MISGKRILQIDRWFARPYAWVNRLPSGATHRPVNPTRILIIKFMGMGSLIQLANHCDYVGIDKSSLVLVTQGNHRTLCAMLGFSRVWLVRGIAPLMIIDILRLFIRTLRWKPELIIDLERCSYAVSILRILLARAGHSYSVSFAADRTAQLPHQEIHPAEMLTLHNLFGIGLGAIPSLKPQQNSFDWSPKNENILINLNASPYLLERRLPTHHLDALLRELRRTYPQAEFLLTGSGREKKYVQKIIDQTPGFRLQNVAGAWSLERLQKELTDCRLFITGDSGPLHLATRIGTPSVVIWGPTQPAHFGYDNKSRIFNVSLNRPCSPCLTHPHSTPMAACGGKVDCMHHIGVKPMITACLTALQGSSGVSSNLISRLSDPAVS
jgi:ADP-heptose:LPS heptosyltransferase